MSTTSITTISSSDHTNKPYFKNPLHRRNDSGELDVFEAARYFEGDQEIPNDNNINSSNITQNLISISREYDNQHHRVQRSGRMSLDMPKRSSNLFVSPLDLYKSIDHSQKSEDRNNKKAAYKQPNSPGAKLASFLNSLFNQTYLKKTKNKAKKKDFEGDCKSPGGWRRKRRSSVGNFRATANKDQNFIINDGDSSSKSMKSSSILGFKAPPNYANTPKKSYREHMEELLSDRNRKHTVSLSDGSYGVDLKLASEKGDKDGRAWNLGDNPRFRDWIDERLDLKSRNVGGDDDDRGGAESDSSSDLFDLPNIHEFDCYSSCDLPVYETTMIAASPVSSISRV